MDSGLVFYIHGGERGFYWRLTVFENLRFFSSLYGSEGDVQEKIHEILNRFKLDNLRERAYGALSSGQRSRVLFLLPFLLPHRIWLLDEPFQNVDIDARKNILESIDSFLSINPDSAVCLATHILDESDTKFSRRWNMKNGHCQDIQL